MTSVPIGRGEGGRTHRGEAVRETRVTNPQTQETPGAERDRRDHPLKP